MFKRFGIGAKLLLMCLMIGILPAMLVGGSALWESREALSKQAFSQLRSMREVKKVQIQDFFKERQTAMQVLLDMVATLRQNAWQKLQTVQENQIAQVEEYLHQRTQDVRILARAEAVAHAIEQFSEALELDSGEPGMAWESIKSLLDKELQHYKTTLGYEDLLLIDKEGKVVYSALQQTDFGQDLKTGTLKDSALGRGMERALAQEEPLLEDFAPYPPAENRQVMFILGKVTRFDKVVGVLAFRMGVEGLNNIMQRRAGLERSGESYLIGVPVDAELTDSSGLISYRSDRKAAAGNVVGTVGSATWGQDMDLALAGKRGLLLKLSERGKLVLSAYAPLAVPDLKWALISAVALEDIITPRLGEEDTDFFGKYLKEYEFHDLFLIHPKGGVFYSVKHEVYYGDEIFQGQYAQTGLGKIAQEVIRSKAFGVSDYAPHAPSGGMPSAFIAQPLLDENGEVQIVVAVQLSDVALNRIMQQREGMGETGETYLVGSDHLMRSNSYLAPETHSIRASFSAPEKGTVNTHSARVALAGKTGEEIGKNYRGDQVLSAYMPLPGMNWALMAEIHASEAFSAIRKLEWLMGGLALMVFLLVWYFSSRFSQHLVTPLAHVNQHLKSLSEGRLVEQAIVYQGNDEIAELVNSAGRLKESMESTIAQANAVASGDYSREVSLLSQHDQLGLALLHMTRILRDMTQSNAQQNWLKSGLAQLNEHMRGTQDLSLLAKKVIDFLCRYLDAKVGLFYVHPGNSQKLKLIASYAYSRRKGLSDEYVVGEGIVGQAALEREVILISEVPADYVQVQSGAGHAAPRFLLVFPLLYETQLKGVIEIGSFVPLEEHHIEFVKQAAPGIGIGVYTAESRTQLQELLQQSQAQAEELQSQSEELQVQQEELRQSNEELEERTRELERQKEEIRNKNDELEKTTAAIEEKARELELASKYKSEFLANMSHELRTPLNSLLILAQLLSNNKDGNLTEKQVEYARTMHHAGSDLLNLINEILDLSKIEAGKIDLHREEVSLQDLFATLDQRFRHVTEQKGLQFILNLATDLPPLIHNDGQRLQQVITNLLSNAFKFTEKGGQVGLTARRVDSHDDLAGSGLNPANTLAIAVSDSGIGIPADKQKLVFEAFQQADGSTSRKYGGTGLGLSITRQLVQLMGGVIRLQSEPGQGSTFTIYIPEQIPGASAVDKPAAQKFAPPAPPVRREAAPLPVTAPEIRPAANPPPPSVDAPPAVIPSAVPPATLLQPTLPDDRDNLQAGDRTLLIVEDDHNFAKLLMELAQEKQFKCLVAEDGMSAIQLAELYLPSAVVLDIGLPQADGWTVMERLKENSKTRHIPIHCVSGSEHGMDARKMGAIGYLLKPVGMGELGEAFKKIEYFLDKTVKTTLIVSSANQQVLGRLFGTGMVEAVMAADQAGALEQLSQREFDCLILDAGANPAENRLHLLEKLYTSEKFAQIPVILYADRELSAEEESLVARCTDHLIVKSVRSPERLLDEATLFLHQVEAALPKEQQKMLHQVHDKEAILRGKKVLVVDDDMRNIYSLTAILEEKGMEVSMAKNGKRALQSLEQKPDVDLVLMDIMMPEMDGYETMGHIRKQERFRKLPIIALTAKAMKGDRAKCIEAGASDYLAKPIEVDKLLSLMRVWLYR